MHKVIVDWRSLEAPHTYVYTGPMSTAGERINRFADCRGNAVSFGRIAKWIKYPLNLVASAFDRERQLQTA